MKGFVTAAENPHVRGQNGHPQPDERIPAQGVGQGQHHRDEGQDLLEDAEEGPHQHEEEGDDEQKDVLPPPEGPHDTGDGRVEDAAPIKHGEGDPHQEDEDDDRDDRDPIGAPQDLDRGREPAPDGVVQPLHVLERLRGDELPPLPDRPRVAARPDDPRQDPGHDHQNQ